MKEIFKEGLDILEEIKHKNKNVLHLTNQGHFMYNSIIIGINAKMWYCLKCEKKVERNREKLIAIKEDMEKLLFLF